MKKLFTIAMLCYGLSASAQTGAQGSDQTSTQKGTQTHSHINESQDFLYLFSDSVIYANNIQFRPDFTGNLRVRVDSRNVSIGQVKFLNSRDGFFANTRKLGGLRTEEFAERIVDGNINVYQERPLARTPFIFHPNSIYENSHVPTSLRYMTSRMYYNIGYEDLKKLNYRNLKQDMLNDPGSMDMLKSYRRSVRTANSLYVAGAASLLSGMILFTSNAKDLHSNTNLNVGIGLSSVGLGMIVGGFFKTISANRKLEATIDHYNR